MIFWSPHIAMLIIKQLFASLYMHTISSCLCSITLSVWIGKFHNILHFRALNQEHIYTTCLYHLSGAFCIVANGFLCYFIMSFSVSVLCQIWAGAKNVCDTWSFIGLVNTILHWISSSSLFLRSLKETFSLPFHLFFSQLLLLLTFIITFCFPYKLSV